MCLANACKSWSVRVLCMTLLVCILNSFYRCNSGWMGTLCNQCVPTSGCCELLIRNSSEPVKICNGCEVELSSTKTKLVHFKANIIKCQYVSWPIQGIHWWGFHWDIISRVWTEHLCCIKTEVVEPGNGASLQPISVFASQKSYATVCLFSKLVQMLQVSLHWSCRFDIPTHIMKVVGSGVRKYVWPVPWPAYA